jgi:nicotinamidase-related amidase
MHVTRVPKWAIERGRGLNDFPALAQGKTALVNIGMQNLFLAEDQVFGNRHARDIVGNVNALSRAMRTAGAPVIWTRQTHTNEGACAAPPWQYDLAQPRLAQAVAALQTGAHGHALYPAMVVEPRDIVIDKYRYGAFACPAGALARTLAELGAETLVITGTLTNVCCESTARDAHAAGYQVIVVGDATAAANDVEHNAALMNLCLNFADVRRTAEVIAMAGRMRP